MNKLFLTPFIFTSLLFCSSQTFGQKVKYEDDTIKVDNKPYAVMIKKSAGAMRSDFAVKSLSGLELIYIKSLLRPWYGSGFRFGQNDELYFEINFIQSGSRAELGHRTGNGFAKMIVDNELISGNAIDAESEKRFIRLNNGYFPTQAASAKEEEKSPAVVVNINNNAGGTTDVPPAPAAAAPSKSKSPVVLDGNKILRDESVIGKFRQDTTNSSYTERSVTITIYSAGGEKAAEATVPLVNPQEWSIHTISDKKNFTILYDSPGERENLFRWLADKKYLGE